MKKSRLKQWVAPGWRRTLSETRAIAEIAKYLASRDRSIADALPPGDRRPILVIPGFLCNDLSTWPLRRFLRRLGYCSFAWKQGINWGPRPGVRTRLLNRVNQLRARCGEPVTIVGWSLGGVYARELACIRPDLVREVITLGSPLHGTPEVTAVWRMFRWINRGHMTPFALSSIEFPHPTQTPCLAIFTEEDGIVPWQICMHPRGRSGRNQRVAGTHTGLVFNPEVMRLLGMHLAQGPKTRTTLTPSARGQCQRQPMLAMQLASAM